MAQKSKGTKRNTASLPYSPATCHLLPLPAGNQGAPVSCVSFQRCFKQIEAYPIYTYILFEMGIFLTLELYTQPKLVPVSLPGPCAALG